MPSSSQLRGVRVLTSPTPQMLALRMFPALTTLKLIDQARLMHGHINEVVCGAWQLAGNDARAAHGDCMVL